ncbi:MAG TPA: isoprenylcysteine carboxylmethyltransferase family protein [Candidatus Acidoferrum sp.]|nr:isoprenylcysteine carboxylmethyltransferase family protein [Candidatus Acidoferrum sp.]
MRGTRHTLWPLFKTLLFTIFVPGTVGIWIPYRVGGSRDLRAILEHVSTLRLASSACFVAIGSLLYLWCAWDFSVKGLGTPAPIDAPKYLVVNGLYRFVRNPMYLGVACLISAQSIFRSSIAILHYMLLFLLCAHLFTVFYEEPHLRRIFGKQYDDYCRQVPRWIPRFPGYRPPAT